MELIPNQPIRRLYVPDNCYISHYNEIPDLFKPKFSPSDTINIQWELDDCGGPILSTDIQIFQATGESNSSGTPQGIVVKSIGNIVTQTTNQKWFTIKIKPADYGLAEGCYFLKWKSCPNDAHSQVRQSNVFYLTDNLSCTKEIIATSNCFGFGFDWSVFSLKWRVPFSKFNPEYDLVMEDNVDSDMKNQKQYAERGKFYSCRTDAMGEGDHDCLTIMLMCDKLIVDGEEWYFPKKEYALDNDKEGKALLYSADFQLRKQGDTPVKNNCQDCNSENYYYYG